MTAPNPVTSTSRIARMTGIAYLGIIASGIFAEFFVRSSLIQPGDAATTADNIASSPLLFRAGLAADGVMIALDISVAIGLYAILRPVHRPLASLAAAFRLIQAAVLGANLMNLAEAMHWATVYTQGGVIDSGASAAWVLSSLELHRVVYDLGLIFFGLSCLVLGHLMRVSRLVPTLLGIGLSIAGAVYLLGSLAVIFTPEFASALDPMYGFTVVAELALAGWLTAKGVAEPTEQRARLAGPGVLLASFVLIATPACGAADEGVVDTQPMQQSGGAGGDSEPEAVTLLDDGERGEYAVGYRVVEDAEEGLVVKTWYPLDEEDSEGIEYEVSFKADYYGAPTGKIKGRARQDAQIAVAKEPFPVVVFSHGFSLNPEWYAVLTEHLASHGFVVLAPEHMESDWETTVVAATFDRPTTVKATIDLAERLNAEGQWAGRLGVDHVAVVGHSYGGYTALASGGARFDVTGLAKRCAELEPTDPKAFLCGPFVSDADVTARLQAVSRGPGKPLQDERVSAIVSIAGDAYLFGEDGLKAVTIPTLAIGGTADNYSPWDWGAELTYDSVGSSRAALVGRTQTT